MNPDWLEPCGAQLVQWVSKSYPNEGCALVVSTGDTFRVIETENLADKYHGVDPEMYPRTSRTFYIINPLEFVEAEDRGERVVAVVHSHADVGDYFSDEDISAALMPQFDESEPREPAHPGVDYLVISVRESGADAASLFRFVDGAFPLSGRWMIEDGKIVTTSN